MRTVLELSQDEIVEAIAVYCAQQESVQVDPSEVRLVVTAVEDFAGRPIGTHQVTATARTKAGAGQPDAMVTPT